MMELNVNFEIRMDNLCRFGAHIIDPNIMNLIESRLKEIDRNENPKLYIRTSRILLEQNIPYRFNLVDYAVNNNLIQNTISFLNQLLNDPSFNSEERTQRLKRLEFAKHTNNYFQDASNQIKEIEKKSFNGLILSFPTEDLLLDGLNTGVIVLNNPISIKKEYNKPISEWLNSMQLEQPYGNHYYRYFFNFLFQKVTPSTDFLNYHLHNSFNEDLIEFKNFLRYCKLDLNEDYRNIIDDWMQNIGTKQIGFSTLNSKQNENNHFKTLENCTCIIKIVPDETKRLLFLNYIKKFLTSNSSLAECYGFINGCIEIKIIENTEIRLFEEALSEILGKEIKNMRIKFGEPKFKLMSNAVIKYHNSHSLN